MGLYNDNTFFSLINKELKALDSMQNLLLQDAPDSCSIDKNINN